MEDRRLPTIDRLQPLSRLLAVLLIASIGIAGRPSSATAQPDPDEPARPPAGVLAGDLEALGLPITRVDVVGNSRLPDSIVLNAIRTAPGDRFDPRTVNDDVQRIYALRRFEQVEAQYEILDGQATPAVAVTFTVSELPAVQGIAFRGNRSVQDDRLRQVVSISVGLAAGGRGDPVLLGFAADAIERFYRDERKRPLANVRVRRDEETGRVIFDITEGPRVLVRNVDFPGARSFTENDLRREVVTEVWWPGGFFGRTGRLSMPQIEEDVASLRRFYQRQKGFFDARVGRRLIWSPDLTEVQVEFVIEEGPRYTVGDIDFEGLEALDEADLRRRLAEEVGLEPGVPYDLDRVRAAINEIVAAYSPLGYIYSPPPPGIPQNPDHLNIGNDVAFRLEPGVVDLTFRVSEGRSFRLGNLRVRGNDKTQDRILLRAFDSGPGDLYDSDDIRRATRRLQGSGYFSQLRVTPVIPPGGDVDDDVRDLLIEVEEMSTATLSVGASADSSGGLSAFIRYEERNFDIFDFPDSPGAIWGDAFQGAGQTLRVSLEPGTRQSNASVTFFEPQLLDRNLGFGIDGYYRTFRQRRYRENRGGGRIRLSPGLGRNFRTTLSLRGEDVRIFDLDAPISTRAPEYVEFEGNTTITSAQLRFAYTDVDTLINTTRGFQAETAWETYGVLGGPSFQKVTAGATMFVPLYRDIRDRAVVFQLRGDAGAIYNDAPFFERFYAGGFTSVRGFRDRGISPRSGTADDAVGGDFMVHGTAALGFPLVDRTLRGVIFSDFGSVDDDPELTTIRVSAGFGFRVNIDALGNVPIALDFAWPLNRRDEDELQVFSFSLGLLQ
jgi:outer membrane protein assembly complex protein YaeT